MAVELNDSMKSQIHKINLLTDSSLHLSEHDHIGADKLKIIFAYGEIGWESSYA